MAVIPFFPQSHLPVVVGVVVETPVGKTEIMVVLVAVVAVLAVMEDLVIHLRFLQHKGVMVAALIRLHQAGVVAHLPLEQLLLILLILVRVALVLHL
jgi:hypothetical protein